MGSDPLLELLEGGTQVELEEPGYVRMECTNEMEL